MCDGISVEFSSLPDSANLATEFSAIVYHLIHTEFELFG